MLDIRKEILDQLAVIGAGITGIVAVGQNVLDVPGLARPALIFMDGTEEVVLERPNSPRRFSQVQLVELTPDIRLLHRAETGIDARSLTSIYRNRLFVAITTDTTLQGILGANGAISYKGMSVPEPNPEAKEQPRVDFTFVFTYPLKISDLT